MAQTWIALDGSQPGTPAQVDFDSQLSSPGQSIFDLTIHGYWSTPRVGPDNRQYQQIEVPGLPDAHVVGSPELPVYRFDLGIVTGAPQAVLNSAQVLDEVVTQGILPWPHPMPALPDSQNTPETFVRDEAVYGSMSDFPSGAGPAQIPATQGAGTLLVAECEVHPIRWNATGDLTIDRRMRYTFHHGGTPSTVEAGSRMEAAAALAGLLNAPLVEPWFSWDTVRYDGYYLFIYPTLDEGAILPLVEQKKKLGFTVTMKRVETIGFATCSDIRHFIESWYAGTPRAAEHYCLLVGGIEWVPMCESPYMPLPVDGTEPGDDLYGDADGDGTDDLGKEVYIGRLSYHNRSGLAPQVARILAYEDHPSGLQSYGTAALVAHRGPPPDTRFTVNQEQVRTATYAGVTPSFETIYGSTPGVGNADITDAFGRVGIISYQGHGGESLWSGWNNALLPDNSYRSSDVDALMNAPVTPVVWSYACQTGDLRSTECLIERMMARGTNGAVSAYGATLEEYIAGSVVSNLAIFRAVFGMGITKQALAIRYAERECTKADRAFNAWMFLLLGDPSMQIRRHDVTDPRTAPWRVESPAMIPASCVGCLYTPRVLTTSGMPAAGVQVSLWKPAPSGPASPATAGPRAPSSAQAADDEVLTNLYTGQDGRATFQLPAMTPGPLYLTVNDDDANVAEDSTLVADPSASEYAEAPLPLRLRVVPSVTGAGARMEFGRGLDRDAIVRLVDVGGRTVGRWRVKRGESALSWDGRDDGGRPLASGVYFARLEESASVLTSKVVVVH